ncbi:hypothetical protein B9Z55_012641 [Caenorhabditis nigoni]|uniref:Uncharacterized protein n=1 Tax=Caenorhabditis nigoni TaxID=1611254 RepID=A0A2G5TY63_9PELO|nr:hypothetical protein B9Z55_012641 [Caenorhabditis nigoni]
MRRFIPSDLASRRKCISQYQSVLTSQIHLQNDDSVPKQMLHHRNQVLEKFRQVPVCTSRLHRHLEPTGYDIARLLQIL